MQWCLKLISYVISSNNPRRPVCYRLFVLFSCSTYLDTAFEVFALCFISFILVVVSWFSSLLNEFLLSYDNINQNYMLMKWQLETIYMNELTPNIIKTSYFFFLHSTFHFHTTVCIFR